MFNRSISVFHSFQSTTINHKSLRATALAFVMIISAQVLSAQQRKPSIIDTDRADMPIITVTPVSTTGQAVTPTSQVDEAAYVGNVYGSVVDADTGKPLPGAEVVLTISPVTRTTKRSSAALAADGGYIVLPRDLSSSKLRTFTDAEGNFLINSIPTPYPEKPYTIVATMPGYVTQVLDQVAVRPGAVMALHLNLALTPGWGSAKVFASKNPAAPFTYRDKEPVEVPPAIDALNKNESAAMATAASENRRIFATREGLVGGTTANGHVIQPNDHFVALPSRLSLSKNFGYEFQVKLSYNGRVTYAPVWDVGPQNKNDDYWNPPGIRAMWRDLPQGLPEVQAAFQSGYNGGKDGYGDKVPNPAGIDIADGTFRNDLKMTNNDWVTVEYQWTSGNADFSLSRSPDLASIIRGNQATFQVTAWSSDGFNSPVNVSVSGLPSGTSASSATLQPPINGSATKTITITTASTTPTGTFTLSFVGTCGTVVRKTSALLTINAPPPPPGQVTVNATLNGKAWSGSVNYIVAGPSGSLIGRAVPGTTKNLTPGRYSIGSISGGPGALISVGPAITQTLNPSGAITFTLNFKR